MRVIGQYYVICARHEVTSVINTSPNRKGFPERIYKFSNQATQPINFSKMTCQKNKYAQIEDAINKRVLCENPSSYYCSQYKSSGSDRWGCEFAYKYVFSFLTCFWMHFFRIHFFFHYCRRQQNLDRPWFDDYSVCWAGIYSFCSNICIQLVTQKRKCYKYFFVFIFQKKFTKI